MPMKNPPHPGQSVRLRDAQIVVHRVSAPPLDSAA
jgi:hypothetical protein